MAYTTINKGSSYFNTVLYTGTQTQQTINVGFQPDFVWIKSRSNVQVHALFDAVRGTSIGALQSNADATENANQKLVAYTSTGFTLPSVNYEWTNTSGWTFASWNWLGANTTVSNTSGTITSTVSANTTSGFSVVGYTGNGSSAQTVGHGLGATPKIIFIKRRNSASDWQVGNSNDFTKQLHLNDTTAYTANAGIFSAPNSTTFTIGNNSTVNGSSDTFIAYCFAEIKGYSKIGSYTGNGSADGTFIYTGFKPAFFLNKRTDTTSSVWFMFDNKRNTFNVVNADLYANTDDSESTTNRIDFLSNGFKIRNTSTSLNASGGTYIYMAFAENPFVSSKGLPCTAR
jgi:hypothetical protein